MLLCFFLLGVFAGGRGGDRAAITPTCSPALAAIGAFAAVFNPTRAAIVPEIVRRDQLQPANAVILVINIIASLIGLKLGEMIIDTAGRRDASGRAC